MAHRGPLREIFIATTFLLLAKKAEKQISPTHTSFIIDAADEIAVAQNVTTQQDIITPPSTGFWKLVFALFFRNFSDIAEELITVAAMELLSYCLPPVVVVIKRWSFSASRSAHQIIRSFRASEGVTDGTVDAAGAEDGSDVGCDPDKKHPPQAAEGPDNTRSSTTDDQLVSNLQAEAAKKDAQIAALTQAANEKSKNILDINRQNDNFVRKLRITLDPNDLYKSAPDLFVVAENFTQNYGRVSRKLESQRETIEKAEDQGTQISTLTAENTRLATDLERQRRDAAKEAKWEKEKTEATQKKLRERALEAERIATDGTVPIESYRRKLEEVHDLKMALAKAENEKADAKKEDEAAHRALRQEVNGLKADIQRLQDADKQSKRQGEEQARKLQAENDHKLELANKTAQDAEEKVEAAKKEGVAAEKKVEVAEKKIEAAEKKAEAAEKKVRASEEEAGVKEKKVGSMNAEINELRSQLANAQEQNAKARHTGYLDALSQNQPSDQNGKTSDHTLSGHGREKETTSQEDELRGQIDQLTADLQLARANQQNEIDRVLASERLKAQRTSDESQEVLREQLSGQWATESRRLQDTIRGADSEIDRLNEAGRGVERRLNDTIHELSGVRQQLTDSQATSAQQAIDIRQLREVNSNTAKQESELQKARNDATQHYDNGKKQWERAEAAEKRVMELEAEVERYKRGKEYRIGQIKDRDQQIIMLKRKIPANAELEAAEFEAVADSRHRACTIIEEFSNRHYDFASRNVLVKLMEANDKIDELKVELKKPATRSSREIFLGLLDGAEVDKAKYKGLNYMKRQVLVRQCAAVNAKLAVLRHIINGNAEPNKDELLVEIYKPRGDEEAVWDDQLSESEPESDEDDDGNNGDDGNSVTAIEPFVPLPARSRKKPSQQSEAQNAPMPSNPNSDNPLKRKINPDDNESEGSGKRHVDSDMGMRPIAGPFPQPPQQGSSSPEADIDQSETKPESQDNLASSEWIGEAAAPQIQSSDPAQFSPQALGSSFSSTQNSSTTQTTPATWSATPTQVDNPFHPKPTKIPGPKAAEAHQTRSDRQERLTTGGRQDKNAAPAQNPIPSTGEGSTGFSFSVPRHISSADIVRPTPVQPSHKPIFHGLSMLGAAMADKDSALPGLPPPEADDVIDFGSSTIAEDRESDSEADDGFRAHTISDGEEDDETIWEDALYPEERENHLDIDLRAYTSTINGNETWPSLGRALDMTEQNYEEQAAGVAAGTQGILEVQRQNEGQPRHGEQEDNFHINLDED